MSELNLHDKQERLLEHLLEQAVHKSYKVNEEVAFSEDEDLSINHQINLYGLEEDLPIIKAITKMKLQNNLAKFYKDISPENRIIAQTQNRKPHK